MFHKMSELRGWTHETMIKMDKRLFLRYFGYWYQDQLYQEMQREEANKPRNDKPKQWKPL